ncbi:MAG: macro domain-containing protein [Anaerofustis stercorihominis]|nr:macro domain-containing protein [Anaerofustis stercorihominis]
MSMKIIYADITKLKVDAIVNAANATLLGGGGVDGAIHSAAGKGLLEECKTLGGCSVGEAKITRGYLLPAKYVIHTVGPICYGGTRNEETDLKNCYINSLKLAKSHDIRSIAFPVISAGAYGYPKREAMKILVQTVSEEIMNTDILAYAVIFDKELINICEEEYRELVTDSIC